MDQPGRAAHAQARLARLLLEKLARVLPPVALPKDAEFSGPLEIRGTASGSPTAAQIEVAFDLTPATLMLPALAASGDSSRLEFKGRVQGADRGILIDRLGLTLGPLALLLRGQVRSGDDLDLKGGYRHHRSRSPATAVAQH